METKKELTKDLLTASFKELLMLHPFEKITIKMITDGAGVIRPTFYKHFQDKYELIEWIFQTEISDKIQVLIDSDMEEDIFRLFCHCLERERAFYKRAYAIQGTNSFENLMTDYVYNIFLGLLNKYPFKAPARLEILSRESVARFYTFGLTDSLKYWIMGENSCSADELCSAYDYIIRNSILDLVQYPGSK